MKKNEKKIETIVYEAFDGTEFKTMEECMNYEGSGVGILLEKMQGSIYKKVENLGFFDAEKQYTRYNTYYIINPRTRTDISVLNNILDMAPENKEQVSPDDCFSLIALCLNLKCNTVAEAHIIRFSEVIKNLSNNKFEVISFIKDDEKKKELR